MDFINDLTHGSGHKAEHKAYDSTPSQPTHTQPEHQSLFDKFGDAVDTLSGKTHTPPPPPPPKKSENIFDRINDALNFGEAPPPPPPPPKSEGIFDKISDVLHAGRSEEPPKPQTFGDKVEDKLNSALGGGSRGEAKEGHLDKAVDFVQEHVLKEGRQDNESALEQAKDKQIASAIRHGFESVTGKEFPSSQKDRDQ